MRIILNTNPFVIPEIIKEGGKLFISIGSDLHLEIDKNYLEHLRASIDHFICEEDKTVWMTNCIVAGENPKRKRRRWRDFVGF